MLGPLSAYSARVRHTDANSGMAPSTDPPNLQAETHEHAVSWSIPVVALFASPDACSQLVRSRPSAHSMPISTVSAMH